MNLARVEYYFAEFLSLLELSEERQIISVLPPYIEEKMVYYYYQTNGKRALACVIL